MILVTVAVEFEGGGLRGRLPENFELLVTGIGGEKTRRALKNFFTERGVPQMLVSTGFAGGLHPRLRAGDLFLAANYTDFAWSERLARREWATGRLHTAGEIVTTCEGKRKLRESCGADAVDMETEEIFRLCREQGVPVISLRAISDAASTELAFSQELLGAAGERPVAGGLRLMGHLAAHPGRIAAFCRLLGDSAKARAAVGRGVRELAASLDPALVGP